MYRLKYPPKKWKRWAVQQFRRPEVLLNVIGVVVEQLEKYRELRTIGALDETVINFKVAV